MLAQARHAARQAPREPARQVIATLPLARATDDRHDGCRAACPSGHALPAPGPRRRAAHSPRHITSEGLMLTRRTVYLAALGVTLGASLVTPAAAQSSTSTAGRRALPTLETEYTRIRFDAGGRKLSANGIGARLMWQPFATTDGPSSPLERTAVGVFATYTPEHTFSSDVAFHSIGAGAALDVRPLAAPIASRLDPYVTLGLGALHTGVRHASIPLAPPLFRRSTTAFTTMYGVGAQALLTSRLGLQGDVRDLVTFGSDAMRATVDSRHNLAFSAGLRFTL
jgi:hypothetical protein